MLTPIEAFLIAIDEQWPTGEEKIIFRILGSTALMLQTNYLRGTKDGDVLGVDPISGDIAKALHGLAGQGSDLSRQHGIFLDIVSRHTPFLAHPPNWIPVEALNQRLKSFEVFALDVQDVVVAKLKRFNENDMSDIRAMIERDLVDHGHLVRRFLSAADCFAVTPLAKEVPAYAMNLNFIEREYTKMERISPCVPFFVWKPALGLTPGQLSPMKKRRSRDKKAGGTTRLFA